MSHNPTEHAQEHITHEAAHGGGAGWITAAALTAAFLAAFAAVSSSMATKHLTESTLKRIDANDNWSHYDSKSVKLSNIDTRDMTYNNAMAQAGGASDALKKQHQKDNDKRAEYKTKLEDEKNPEEPEGMDNIRDKATELVKVSKSHLETHETYEMSATMFHIAIAVVAIAVVAKRKEFWWMSIVGGIAGMYFFGVAYARAPREHEEHGEAAAHATAPAAPGEHAAPAGEHAPAGEKAAPTTGHGSGEEK